MPQPEFGGIYTVSDDPRNPVVKFPANNIPGSRRTHHPQRYVLVVQADAFNEDKEVESVLVVPLSSKGRDTPITIEIHPTLSEEMPDEPSVALIQLIQPIHKRFLNRKVGQLDTSGQEFKDVRSGLLRVMDFL